jgi:signal transduction histidine kinase
MSEAAERELALLRRALERERRAREEAERLLESKSAELWEHHKQLHRIATHQLISEEEQRAEFARLIHEGLGQELAVALLFLRRLGGHEQLDSAIAGVERAIDTVRRISMLVSPPALTQLGLSAAIQMIGRDLTSRQGVGFDFEEVSTHARYPRSIEMILFRCVRELLVNALRHSGGTHVGVFIEHHSDAISITVSDDGCGVDEAEHGSDGVGFGLVTIREQLASVGGTLSLKNGPESGLIATVSIALEPAVRMTEELYHGAVSK